MLSLTTEYALRAATHLATHAGPVANAELARANQIPAGYLAKVMRDLVLAKLVVGSRGPGGGFSLARPPQAITILDIVIAVDPFRRIESCPLGNPDHARLCPLHRRLDDAMALVEESFRATTLAELIEPSNRAGSRDLDRACDRLPSPRPPQRVRVEPSNPLGPKP